MRALEDEQHELYTSMSDLNAELHENSDYRAMRDILDQIWNGVDNVELTEDVKAITLNNDELNRFILLYLAELHVNDLTQAQVDAIREKLKETIEELLSNN